MTRPLPDLAAAVPAILPPAADLAAILAEARAALDPVALHRHARALQMLSPIPTEQSYARTLAAIAELFRDALAQDLPASDPPPQKETPA